MFSSIINRARGVASGIASRVAGVARRVRDIPRAARALFSGSDASPR